MCLQFPAIYIFKVHNVEAKLKGNDFSYSIKTIHSSLLLHIIKGHKWAIFYVPRSGRVAEIEVMTGKYFEVRRHPMERRCSQENSPTPNEKRQIQWAGYSPIINALSGHEKSLCFRKGTG